jgi:hypothetical protein
MLGQGILPRQYQPVAGLMGGAELPRFDGIRAQVDNAVRQLPSHQEHADRYCPAVPVPAITPPAAARQPMQSYAGSGGVASGYSGRIESETEQ